MSESSFRTRVRAVVTNELEGQCTSVETAGSAGGGVPDVELCLPGGWQAWLELKVHDVSSPTRAKKISHFRQQQARWLRERARLGARAGLFVMARSGSAREYVVLDAETAALLWLDQRAGRAWSWAQIRERAVVVPAKRLSAQWLDAAVKALPAL